MTTGTAASSPKPDTIVDTVVLRYFLLVEQTDLLLQLVGSPLAVPRVIFDPDEADDLPEEMMSELRRSITVQQARSTELGRSRQGREDAALKAARLDAVFDLDRAGSLAVIDMSDEERDLFGRILDRESAAQFGLHVPLDIGEAACVAIAVHRQWHLATDDDDALRAVEWIDASVKRLRIRALLRLGAEGSLITRDEANTIHAEMKRMGFWDTEAPFA